MADRPSNGPADGGTPLESEHQRLRFVAKASEILASSLDYETTLASVADLAIPKIADWVTIHLLNEAGAIERLKDIDPEREAIGAELDQRFPPNPAAPVGIPYVIRTGESEFYPVVSDPVLRAVALDADHLEVLRGLGIGSAMSVALTARGHILGAITLLIAESNRVYTADDLLLAEDLARRAAVAIDNSRLYQDRLAVEQELRASQAQLEAALSAAHMGAWEWNIRTGGLKWSRNLEPLHGFLPGTFQGTFEAFIEVVHPEDRPLLVEGITRCVETGDDFEVEFRNIHADGSLHWIAGKGQVFKDESGVPERMVGMGMDITEQRRLTAELQQQAENLTAADQYKDRFLATLSHEMRTPLGAMTNALHVLSSRIPPEPPLQRPIDTLGRQIAVMTRLVSDLQDIARLKQGMLDLRSERASIDQVVQHAIEAARPLIDARGHDLLVSLPDTPIWVEGDSTRLVQVFSNLLNNAAKYTDLKGQIRLTAEMTDHHVSVRVRDNGIGIDPVFLPQVFDLFVQEDHARGRSHGGLGIGLALVKGLVEAHGGSIIALSAGLQQGSEFVVKLPLSQSSA